MTQGISTPNFVSVLILSEGGLIEKVGFEPSASHSRASKAVALKLGRRFRAVMRETRSEKTFHVRLLAQKP
jgi:hypothetical protein